MFHSAAFYTHYYAEAWDVSKEHCVSVQKVGVKLA